MQLTCKKNSLIGGLCVWVVTRKPPASWTTKKKRATQHSNSKADWKMYQRDADEKN